MKANRSKARWHKAVALAVLLGLSVMPGLAAGKKVEWILRQHQDFQGPLDVYVSHDAVKVVALKSEFHLLCKAPSWTVHCFRPVEKVEWTGNLDKFNGAMLESPVEEGSANRGRTTAGESGVYKGLKYTDFPPYRRSHDTLYGTGDIDVAPQVVDFLCRLYDIPNPGKFPIFRTRFQVPEADDGRQWHLDFKDKRRGRVTDLDTKSWKKVPYNALDFEYPVNYKKMTRLTGVAYSKNQQQAINEVFDEVGFASEAGSHKEKKPSGR